VILSGKVLTVAATVAALLIAALGWQTWRLDRATKGEATAQATLEVCRGLNQANRDEIDRINQQAAEAIADAEKQREREAEAVRDLSQERAAQAGEIAELERRLALATVDHDRDVCRVPADVERLFRERAINPHRDGNPDG
jgi:hypothetical protein